MLLVYPPVCWMLRSLVFLPLLLLLFSRHVTSLLYQIVLVLAGLLRTRGISPLELC